MDNNYQVIRLINGTTIIGDIITSLDEFIIQYPLEVHFKPVINSQGKLTGEQMTLRPYLILTREKRDQQCYQLFQCCKRC